MAKLVCNAGHEYDLSSLKGKWDANGKKEGDRCGRFVRQVSPHYTKYCRCTLQKIEDEDENTDNRT